MTGSILRRSRLAAVAASGALLLSGCEFSVYSLPLPGGADLGDDPYHVVVEFRDVLDLVPQSAVKVDDISVGRVDDVELDGYSAKVTVLLRKDVELPDNAVAKIRQTSLLGEKFVDLGPPASNPSANPLGEGDTIKLEDSGRNPEVEEVLGALSLILNGGGVGQLKLITSELNKALGGRESSARSVFRQLNILMGQLDDGKDEILQAIDSVNSLAISLNKRTSDLDLALKELPTAIASVDRQRDDLIKMLQALSKLSAVGTQVIQASKQGTIDSLNALAPVLTQLAASGDDFVNSLQIVLTFPFIDAVVGKNAAQARDLHLGDYTNLNVKLDIDLPTILGNLGDGDGGGVPTGLPTELPTDIITSLLPTDLPSIELPGGGGGGGGLPSLPGGLGRAGVGGTSSYEPKQVQRVTELAGLLLWGVAHK